MSSLLTSGAAIKLRNIGVGAATIKDHSKFQPVLQVIELVVTSNNNNNAAAAARQDGVVRVQLSDGTHYLEGRLTKNLTYLVEDNAILKKFAIVTIKEFDTEKVFGRVVCIVKKMEVTRKRVYGVFGTPVHVQDDDAAAASSAIHSSLSGGVSLSPNALYTMIHGRSNNLAAADNAEGGAHHEFMVRLGHIKRRNIQEGDRFRDFLSATVWDDKFYTTCFWIQPSSFPIHAGFDYVVSVQSYISSQANCKEHQFLLLVDTTLVCRQKAKSRGGGGGEPLKYHPKDLLAGNSGTFLSERVPFFSNNDLAGVNALDSSSELLSPESYKTVTDVLAHHAAMVTLHGTSSDRPDNNNNNAEVAGASSPQHVPVHRSAATNYMSALKEFSISQINRQEASLMSHVNRHGAQVAAQVVRQHAEALHVALQKQHLSPQVLCECHKILCNGLHPEAGQFRSKNVRAGSTRFAQLDQVQSQIDKYCQSVASLKSRLVDNNNKNNNDGGEDATTRNKVTFAAAVMFGFVDIHPFADGNGRMCRIAANWALHKAGLPFCINMHATQPQRREYVSAVQKTRRNLSLVCCGGGGGGTEISDTVLHQAIVGAGLFRPLVTLLMERLDRVCTEFQQVVQSKSLLASEEAEARAARRFRERAASGSCIICFEPRPNIATLCCGKAVHLNCIAQWLSSNQTCPQCRAQMPSMRQQAPPPPAAARVVNNNANDDTDGWLYFDETTTSDFDSTETTTEYDEEAEEALRAQQLDEVQAQLDEVDTTESTYSTTEVDADETTEEMDAVETTEEVDADEITEEVDADETTEEVDDQDEDTHWDETTTSMDDTEETEETTTDSIASTTDETTATRQSSHYASHPCGHPGCRNRAAVDCSNGFCGRCCVLHGAGPCARHDN